MSQTHEKLCPVCKLPGQQIKHSAGAERLAVSCVRCGKFTITATAARMAESRGQAPLLSSWIREATEAGRELPEINSRNLDTIALTIPAYSVSDKQLLLVRAIARKTRYPGDAIELIPEHDFPLAWAANEDEFGLYLATLQKRGLLRDSLEGSHTLGDVGATVHLSGDGWTSLQEESHRPSLSDQAFVAMSFSESLRPQWVEAIGPAVRDAGYMPYRVDAEPHIDRIDAKIVEKSETQSL